MRIILSLSYVRNKSIARTMLLNKSVAKIFEPRENYVRVLTDRLPYYRIFTAFSFEVSEARSAELNGAEY